MSLQIDPDNWTPENIVASQRRKEIKKEISKKGKPSIKDLGKFHPDDFEMFEGAFKSLLVRTAGALGEPLHYVIWDETPPEEFMNDGKRHKHNTPLTGDVHTQDNKKVHKKLKAFLINAPATLGLRTMIARKMGMQLLCLGPDIIMEELILANMLH